MLKPYIPNSRFENITEKIIRTVEILEADELNSQWKAAFDTGLSGNTSHENSS